MDNSAVTPDDDTPDSAAQPPKAWRISPTSLFTPDPQRLPTITEGVPQQPVEKIKLRDIPATGKDKNTSKMADRDRRIPKASLPDINVTVPEQVEMDDQSYYRYNNNGYSSIGTGLDQEELPPSSPTQSRLGKRSLSVPSLYSSGKLTRQASKTSLVQRRLSAFTVHTSQRFSEKQLKTMATFSSVNYAPTHSNVYMDWLRDHPARLGWDRWILMLLIGIAIGMVACFLKQSQQALTNIKWDLTRNYAKSGDLNLTFLWLAGVSSSYILVSSFLVAFIHPPAGGSGVPEVISYLNGVIVHGTLSFKNLVVKFISNVFAVSSGLPCAIQGPLIAMGAIVGCGIGQFESKTFGFRPKMFARFRNPEDRRSFTTAGVAAGVAAGFNAPIGGLLFAMEDLSSFWSRRLSWQTFFCCGIAAGTANLFNTAFQGFEYNSGTPFGLFSLSVIDPLAMHIATFAPAIVIGIMGGILGALFTRLNTLIVNIRKKILKGISNKTIHALMRMIECIILAVLMSSMAVYLPTAFKCTRLTDVEDTSLIHTCLGNRTFVPEIFNCKDNETYSEVATLMMNSGTAFLGRLSQRGVLRVYNYSAIGSVLGGWLFMTCWTAGSAISGGTFVPLLISGGLLGRLVGVGILDLYKYATGNVLPVGKEWEWMDPGVMAILGAGSLLGGVTRLTLAITVIIIEMAQDINVVVPVLLANFIAKVTADMISKPLYKYQLESKSLPYLDPELNIAIDGHVRNLEMYSASDVMNAPVKTIHAVESIANLAHLLLGTEHGGFPVVKYDDETRIELAIGLLTRTELYVILYSDAVYNANKVESVIRPDIPYREISVDYIADSSAVLERVRMYAKFPQYQKIYVDLNNFVNMSAPKVDENHSLSRTHALFRTMGLRHLVVVDARNRVVGIITRKDLLPFAVTSRLIGVEARLTSLENSDSDNGDYNDNASEHRIFPPITKTMSSSSNASVSGSATNENEAEYMPIPDDNRSRDKELPIRRNLDETNL